MVTSLPEKKRGRPLLQSEELDKQVCAYVTNLRDNGPVVNTAIAVTCAEGLSRTRTATFFKPSVVTLLSQSTGERTSYVAWGS